VRENASVRISGSHPVLAVHDLDRSGDHSYVAYLRVDDVDGFHARAVAAGAEVLKAPTDEPWGMREIGVRSPDGHRFMLGQRVGPALPYQMR
jgi:uncharacterized glyoxalase superfamily protein PhnB